MRSSILVALLCRVVLSILPHVPGLQSPDLTMPITVAEKWDSREGTQGEGASTDLRYIIRGTDDDSAARDALVANSPAFYNLLIRQSAHIARLGEDTWEGTVRYGTNSPPQTGQSSFSFDTGGGSQHITQGRGTVARYSAPGKEPPMTSEVANSRDVETRMNARVELCSVACNQSRLTTGPIR